jgi:hypothetical protein
VGIGHIQSEIVKTHEPYLLQIVKARFREGCLLVDMRVAYLYLKNSPFSIFCFEKMEKGRG